MYNLSLEKPKETNMNTKITFIRALHVFKLDFKGIFHLVFLYSIITPFSVVKII